MRWLQSVKKRVFQKLPNIIFYKAIFPVLSREIGNLYIRYYGVTFVELFLLRVRPFLVAWETL